MMRALKIGEKEDWNFLPYAVDFKTSKKFEWKPTLNFLHNMNVTQSASHELLGLVAYYLLGRTNKIF